MRWFAWFILAYVALALQIGVVGHLRLFGGSANLPLICAVFIALHAPRDAALLGCFCLGLMQDLLIERPPGIHALAYGLGAMAIHAVAATVDRQHPFTHALLTLLGGLALAAMLSAQSWLRGLESDGSAPWVSAAISGVAAMVVIWALRRARSAFAFQSRRRMRAA